jgi:pimeloyl-ACP methyl ester carboxylesterase
MSPSNDRPRREAGLADINGSRLYYELTGTGPALLFLHGFTLDRRMWKHQVAALSDHFTVVAYDARGFGRSSMPGSEPYRHYEDAAALCAHLGLERVVVIGHSIGGHQMLELALARPDLVAGWVAVGFSGLATVPFPADVMKMFAEVRDAARGGNLALAKSIWAHGGWFAPAREVPSISEELDVMFADYTGWHWTNVNPAQNLDPPAAEQLDKLRCPALLITGGRDIPYNEAVRKAMQARLPGAKDVFLPDASHMANMEQPDIVNRAIADFATLG